MKEFADLALRTVSSSGGFAFISRWSAGASISPFRLASESGAHRLAGPVVGSSWTNTQDVGKHPGEGWTGRRLDTRLSSEILLREVLGYPLLPANRLLQILLRWTQSCSGDEPDDSEMLPAESPSECLDSTDFRAHSLIDGRCSPGALPHYPTGSTKVREDLISAIFLGWWCTFELYETFRIPTSSMAGI